MVTRLWQAFLEISNPKRIENYEKKLKHEGKSERYP